MKKLISLALALALTFMAASAAFASPAEELAFSNGEFRILVLADTQDDMYPSADMLNLLRLAIDETRPDLIAVCGDLVEDWRFGETGVTDGMPGEGVVAYDALRNIKPDETFENVRTAADKVLSVIQDSGVPFAIAQGDNDRKTGLTGEQWLEIYSAYPGCLVTDMSGDGQDAIDYALSVKSSSGETALRLWFMDTLLGGVTAEQLDWYRAEAEAEPVPAFAFQHIPVDEVGNLFVGCSPADDGARYQDGKWYRLNKDVAEGYYLWAPVPGGSSAEFSAWKEAGDVKAAFFGHHHYQGYSGVYDGIELSMVYGSQFAKSGPHGFRLVTVSEDDLSFSNESFVYTGSAVRGTARIEPAVDAPYEDKTTPPARLFELLKNLFMILVDLLTF